MHFIYNTPFLNSRSYNNIFYYYYSICAPY